VKHDNPHEGSLSRNLRDLLKHLVSQFLEPDEASLAKFRWSVP
jgi:hypothetical protein